MARRRVVWAQVVAGGGAAMTGPQHLTVSAITSAGGVAARAVHRR